MSVGRQRQLWRLNWWRRCGLKNGQVRLASHQLRRRTGLQLQLRRLDRLHRLGMKNGGWLVGPHVKRERPGIRHQHGVGQGCELFRNGWIHQRRLKDGLDPVGRLRRIGQNWLRSRIAQPFAAARRRRRRYFRGNLGTASRLSVSFAAAAEGRKVNDLLRVSKINGLGQVRGPRVMNIPVTERQKEYAEKRNFMGDHRIEEAPARPVAMTHFCEAELYGCELRLRGGWNCGVNLRVQGG